MRALRKTERIGRYELLGEIGSGGMGVVYRAYDTKLRREVAIKVLAASLAKNAEAVARFEREAQAASALAHPNVLTLFDIGMHRGASYLVYELLRGGTLRERLAKGPLPAVTAVDYMLQIASGVSAAHAKGIVHRDLKPENLFIIEGGQVKILDFGIAKLLPQARYVPVRFPSADPKVPSIDTLAGAIIGTVGYMSPEQVRGKPADHRSDIFALGAILYEMLSGSRAFPGELFDAGMRVLNSEPPALDPAAPPGLEDVIRRCLKKEPQERFQSVAELESSLARVKADLSTGKSPPEIGPAPVPPSPGPPFLPGRPWLLAIAIVVVVAAVLGVAWKRRCAWFGVDCPNPVFDRLTFGRGVVWSARFLADGKVVYSSAWDGNKIQAHTVVPGKPGSSSLGVPPGRILSVLPGGDLAVALERDEPVLDYMRTGTLARVDASGAAREMLTNVRCADWGRGGSADPVVVREVDGVNRLEYPPGKVLYATVGWLTHARLSPTRQIAFLEHPYYGDTRGLVMLAADGKVRAITSEFGSAMGLAWSPRGNEIWFTAAETAQSSELKAVTPAGQLRLITRIPGAVLLHDVAPDGRILFSREEWRHFVRGRFAGKREERDLSWLDYSIARELSADGRKLLFFEAGQGVSKLFEAFVRSTDGSPAIDLGPGLGLSLSADGQWAITGAVTDPSKLILVPTGPGESRPLKLPVAVIAEARWFPDGKRILLTAREKDDLTQLRVYVVEVASGKLSPIAGPFVTGQEMISKPVSSDGRRVIIRKNEGYFVYPAEGGDPRQIPGLAEGQVPIAWHPDGSILVRTPGLPTKVSLLDLATGSQTRWREFMPPDPAGVSDVPWLHFAFPPEGEVCAYSYHQILSDLFLGSGLE